MLPDQNFMLSGRLVSSSLFFKNPINKNSKIFALKLTIFSLLFLKTRTHSNTLKCRLRINLAALVAAVDCFGIAVDAVDDIDFLHVPNSD